MIDPKLINLFPNNTALNWINFWIKDYRVNLMVKNSRKRKLGDYKKSTLFSKHQITINNNLDPELFFLTLTHEIAHMMAYSKNKYKKILPHGKEWKNIYSALIITSIDAYSKEFKPILKKFSENPKAGYFSDPSIVEYFTLKKNKDNLLLKNLALGSSFYLENKPYQILEKKRTRYLCKNLTTKKKYLITGLVAVTKV